MLIYKELQNAIYAVTAKLKSDCILEEDRLVEKEKEVLLYEILDYVKTEEAKNKKVSAFLKCNFDYALVADTLGVTKNCVEATVSLRSKKLYSKIGENVIKLIMEGDVVSATLQFRFGIGKMSMDDFIIKGVHDIFDEKKEGSKKIVPNILDCKNELGFLKKYSIDSLRNDLTKIDVDKMLYLLGILNNLDAKHLLTRKYVFSLITGGVSGEDLIRELKATNLYQD